VRRAGGQPRHRASRDRGARPRRPGRSARARVLRDRRGAGRAAQHADEPVRARPIARPGRHVAGAGLRGASGDARRGGGVRHRPRRRAARAPAPAHARRPADLARPQPRPAAPAARGARRRLHDGVAVRRTRRRRPPPHARRLRGRGARRGRRRGRASRAGAGRAGPADHHRGDQGGRPGRRSRPHDLPGRSLPVPGDADAPPTTGEGEGQ
jgi:hypothetical protein